MMGAVLPRRAGSSTDAAETTAPLALPTRDARVMLAAGGASASPEHGNM
jgi:hypothetical protein